MTHNRRYEGVFDEINRRQIEEWALRPQPISLTAEELDVDHHPITVAPQPIRVRGWVRYPESVVRVLADAFEWNDIGVHVRWRAPDGSGRNAWIYANAVRRLGSPVRDLQDRDLGTFYTRRSDDDDPPPGPR